MFMLPLIIWILLYSRSASKRRHPKLVFFGQLAGLVCFLLLPTVLGVLGIIDKAVGAHRDRVRFPAADADIHCAVIQAVQEA